MKWNSKKSQFQVINIIFGLEIPLIQFSAEREIPQSFCHICNLCLSELHVLFIQINFTTINNTHFVYQGQYFCLKTCPQTESQIAAP